MQRYDHKKIEKKWQKEWAKQRIYTAPDSLTGKDNFYLLVEFPYPSGNLHAGHWYAFAIPDILARAFRMQGKNVLYPIGFDAFGLPAENAAIKNKLNPRKWTEGNIAYMKKQIASMGTSFDWSREVITCDPEYYKWTQWLFLQLFKKGLAYQKETAVNWCPNCKTVLANEQVLTRSTGSTSSLQASSGQAAVCERCETEVVQKQMLQWNVKITDYADRLIDDLAPLDWPEQIKESQRNWIGRSEGAEIDFPLKENGVKRFVLLHGKGGTPLGAFKPWLKQRLEGLGYEVQVPALPNSGAPSDEEQADYVEKTCALDEQTVVVGHSFGGVVALRLLERGHKVKRVALVATPFSGAYVDGGERPTVTAALKRGFDFEMIRRNAEFAALYDVGDRVVPMSDGEAYAEKLGCALIRGKGSQPHFNGAVENDVFAASVAAIRVFTTRADTLFGATYLVLAPEHPLLRQSFGGKAWIDTLSNKDEIGRYIALSAKKTDMDRQTNKEKTGVRLEGVDAINPATKEKIPIYIADYVLGHYGTGAIMAVPAHDERDFEFASRYNLPIKEVISARNNAEHTPVPSALGGATGQAQNGADKNARLPYTGEGLMIDSGKFTGIASEKGRRAITEELGVKKTTYKLRDWIVSRQRYWGVPIPIVHCKRCGSVPVPDKDLPLELPEVKDYLPDGRGKSPLAKVKKWVNVKCPKCKTPAERETDTLDTFVDSSWYFLRYTDPKNKKEFAAKNKQGNWMPVDMYSGGAEHTTMHLLYSRFWHKALFDLGLVADSEPYKRRMNRSLILGPDGQKMSKSRGNVVDPDEAVERLGADTVRMYLAFIGPYNEVSSYPWNPDGVVGVRRFLERVWQRITDWKDFVKENPTFASGEFPETEKVLNKMIAHVTRDVEKLKFNTAISAMMIFLNHLRSEDTFKIEDSHLSSHATEHHASKFQLEQFLRILAPFAPHIAEELWHEIGNETSIHQEAWPAFDPALLKDENATIVVQINGKTRGEVQVPSDSDKKTIEDAARAAVAARLSGQNISRTIVVPGRLVNFVISEKV